jgi:hypothetical protein
MAESSRDYIQSSIEMFEETVSRSQMPSLAVAVASCDRTNTYSTDTATMIGYTGFDQTLQEVMTM